MSLLTAPIVKNGEILAEVYFVFLTKVLEQTSKIFSTKLRPQCKNWRNSYEVRQILVIFCKLVALILD